MEINVVQDEKTYSFLELAKLSKKVIESSGGYVNRLDIESLNEAIPDVFEDDSGWSFKHLPSGVSQIEDSILRNKLRVASDLLDHRLLDKMNNLILELGILSNTISNISSKLKMDGLSLDKSAILLDNISKLYLKSSRGISPLIANDEDDAADLSKVEICKGYNFELVESNIAELNRSILLLN